MALAAPPRLPDTGRMEGHRFLCPSVTGAVVGDIDRFLHQIDRALGIGDIRTARSLIEEPAAPCRASRQNPGAGCVSWATST